MYICMYVYMYAGLVGPLYPAFSLYNEDDQLTIKQIKSKASDGSSFRGDTSKDHGIGTYIHTSVHTYIHIHTNHAFEVPHHHHDSYFCLYPCINVCARF